MASSLAQFYQRVEDDALHLPLEDRSKLASRLLESLDDDEELSPEWKTEIQRRVQSIENGTAKLISHEEVQKRVRASLAKSKQKS